MDVGTVATGSQTPERAKDVEHQTHILGKRKINLPIKTIVLMSKDEPPTARLWKMIQALPLMFSSNPPLIEIAHQLLPLRHLVLGWLIEFCL